MFVLVWKLYPISRLCLIIKGFMITSGRVNAFSEACFSHTHYCAKVLFFYYIYRYLFDEFFIMGSVPQNKHFRFPNITFIPSDKCSCVGEESDLLHKRLFSDTKKERNDVMTAHEFCCKKTRSKSESQKEKELRQILQDAQ